MALWSYPHTRRFLQHILGIIDILSCPVMFVQLPQVDTLRSKDSSVVDLGESIRRDGKIENSKDQRGLSMHVVVAVRYGMRVGSEVVDDLFVEPDRSTA